MARLKFDRQNLLSLASVIAALIAAIHPAPALAQNTQSGPPSVSILPYPDPQFKGVIGRTTADSKSDFPQPVSAPKDAPNVLLIMTDDVGFGASSTFGGPVATPTLDALAASGINTTNSTPRRSARQRVPRC